MYTSWFYLLYLIVVWAFAIYSKSNLVGLGPSTIFLSAIFFLIYFFLPLMKRSKGLISLSIFLLNLVVFLNFWSQSFNGFILLIILVLAKETLDNLKGLGLYFHLFSQYIIVISPYVISQASILLAFVNLLILRALFIFLYDERTNRSYKVLIDKHDRLENDYRRLKRQVVMNEKQVRQEERNQIAREIHDSVGHRLTALLMQIEVVRLQAKEGEEMEKIDHLKSLAQVSLKETREAVNALKSEEIRGLSSVISLIRKLESESHLEVDFHIQGGALSFPLSNQQSITLYRSVQEALTNMMRHSGSRQAVVDFRVIAGNFFRFQISNPLKEKVEFKEGFGLTAMRERMEQIEGSLNISQFQGEFIVTGTFPMEKED